MSQIAPESKEFLVSLFTELRADLKGDRAIFDALLSGLAEDGELPPEDETLREYVTGLARAIDEENRYEQAVLEHRAFAELARALGAPTEHGPASVNWDVLLAGLLHPIQFQIIEAMHWIERPTSASQLVQVFDCDPDELSTLSYHLRRLRTLKIVRLSWVRRVRGAKERLYKLIAVNGR